MNKISANDFRGMIKSGYANLQNNAEEINTLNVFPVPDGDTGTNMSMTMENGYKEAMKCTSDSVSDVAKALSRGLLMGARGNSGVITSQIFRGFYQYIDGKDELEVKDYSEAFENGARVAYKAIMKPVEGTILTVIREASWYANHDYQNEPFDLNTYFDKLYSYSEDSLNHTPDYLPVLKEVGVVDSGGMGLLKIIEGFKLYFEGKPVELKEQSHEVQVNPALMLENDEFGYCTEFILRLESSIAESFDENRLKRKLTDMGGESLVVVKDEDLVKVHVHTLKPGEALNIAQRYGEFVKLKIENMQEQHSTIISNAQKEENKPEEKTEKTPKKYGIVSVAAGEGVTQLFYDLGCDVVVSGGQTMNPSTEDFVKVINDLDNCENIFIFPNNSNIILAARQAQSVMSDRNVEVIETKSIQAGISAIGFFNPEVEAEDNVETMNDIISNVYASSVTYAIKDTSFEGVTVREGDYIAMANKTIVASDVNQKTVIEKLMELLSSFEDKEILTIITGEGSEPEITDYIEEYISKNTSFETQIIQGDQPVYSYLFGLE
ncbi:MAG: DAK2 domain-containing protein [Erysipelotrichaceae bacterium]|nr:DAK2 domain-containing protein [Erysipelotrichaceae bacterium]